MQITRNQTNHQMTDKSTAINLTINGNNVRAFEGELISTVLQVEGISIFNRKHKTGKPSGIYCGMGVCYECLVTVNGVPNVRACQTYAKDGMEIITSSPVLP
jgi:sarcosine oxidase subunit alpha